MNEERHDNDTEEPTLSAVPEPVETPAEVATGDLTPEELANELEVARAEIERLQDQSLRRQAELVNFRRRAQKELAEASALGQGRLLESLLPVVDDFERAVQNKSDDIGAYHEGLELILRSLHKSLEGIGLERIEPHGETFDPEYHEAIARQEGTGAPEGEVLDVYQPGYKLRDRLIRPAAVVVAFGGAGDGVASSEEAEDADASHE